MFLVFLSRRLLPNLKLQNTKNISIYVKLQYRRSDYIIVWLYFI